MARTLDSPLVDRVYATGVCDVLFFTLCIVCTAVSARPVAGLPHLPVRLAVGLLCLVCPLLPDASAGTAFLSRSVPDGAVDGPVAHGASAGYPRCPRGRPTRRLPQWAYGDSHHCPGHGCQVSTPPVLPTRSRLSESGGVNGLFALSLRDRRHCGSIFGSAVSRGDVLALSRARRALHCALADDTQCKVER